ncbi:carotenoid biosynthesis protein, partial [Saprospiraceae bacterium]|nr:carotenoid biosynthesis protein [Saprospiraceae bacterium]
MSQLLNSNIYKENALGWFLVLVHVSGFIGLLTPARNLFIVLTPVVLILCFLAVLYHHQNKNRHFFIYSSIIVVLGFTIEIIGINTGWPFGVYSYGKAFGPQILGTPPVIGLNWFVLTYCGAILANRVSKSKWLNAVLT